MASLDSLPADQRAVLALVLGRGRSYDEIARLLSIERAAVRARALAAFDALGPQTGVPAERRALITDYLLGQLPPRLADETRARLAESASERAWARVLSSELAPLSSGPLPEISVEGSPARPPAPAADESSQAPVPATPSRPESEPEPEPRRASKRESKPSDDSAVGPAAIKGRNVSRLGGAVLIGIAVVVVVAVVFVVSRLGDSGSGPTSQTSSVASAPSNTATTTTTTTSSTTSSGSAQVVAQINLTPTNPASKAAGIAEVLKEGATDGIAIVAQKMAPNTTKPPNAYAVWLYNSPTDAHILGFVNPGVGAGGRLSTAGALPSNAAHYKELIITLETQATPTTPGTIVLQGALKGI
jgi:Sigma-70, region 4